MLKIHQKNEINEQYGKIAIDGNSNSCCMPSSDCYGTSQVLLSPYESSQIVGYDSDKLKVIPESSILGIGFRNPTRFAGIDEGNTG